MTKARSSPGLMKRSFFYGFRGKARWRTNLVFLLYTAIAVVYVHLGEITWCDEVAKRVPLAWKVVALAALLLSVWYTDRRIEIRVRNPELPPLSKGLLLWLAAIAVIFAVITADHRLLFTLSTSVVVLFLCLSTWYYRRKSPRTTPP